MNGAQEINRREIKGIKEFSKFKFKKKKNIYFIFPLFIIMTCITGISSHSSYTNKVDSNKRELDIYYQSVKIKVNTTGRTGSIQILGTENFETSEIYFNGQKINYKFGSYINYIGTPILIDVN